MRSTAANLWSLEILLEAVFSSGIPKASQSPNIAAFVRFREFWQFVDEDQYRTANKELKENYVDDVLNFSKATSDRTT